MRLDDAQLDRVAAGGIVATADGQATAEGDQFATTSTDTRTLVKALGAAEVGVAISRADAVACCESATSAADTGAATDGDLAIGVTQGNDVTAGPFSRSRSLSIAVGVNTPQEGPR